MSIYAVCFILAVIIGIACLVYWYKEYDIEGTVLYGLYVLIILVLLAVVMTLHDAW